jgi:hypothetical protein
LSATEPRSSNSSWCFQRIGDLTQVGSTSSGHGIRSASLSVVRCP